MAAIEIPEITIIAVASDDVLEATEWALDHTKKQINPASSIIMKMRKDQTFDEVLWYEIPQCVTTSHVLVIQYDGFVLDGSRWNPEWLNYDYIGAPWPWHKDLRVGNGGFSLRSKRLMDFLRDHPDVMPVRHPEDDLLCRVYRPALEFLREFKDKDGDIVGCKGFVWAPEEIAKEFSFEREIPHPTFGFHGLFNLPHVVPDEFVMWCKRFGHGYVQLRPEFKELEACMIRH